MSLSKKQQGTVKFNTLIPDKWVTVRPSTCIPKREGDDTEVKEGGK